MYNFTRYTVCITTVKTIGTPLANTAKARNMVIKCLCMCTFFHCTEYFVNNRNNGFC